MLQRQNTVGLYKYLKLMSFILNIYHNCITQVWKKEDPIFITS